MLPESGAIPTTSLRTRHTSPGRSWSRRRSYAGCSSSSTASYSTSPGPASGVWGVEMTAQKEVELEQLFEQGYRALGVMERHLGDREFSSGRTPRSQTSPSTRTHASVRRAAMTSRTTRRCVPGWTGILPMCRRPDRRTQDHEGETLEVDGWDIVMGTEGMRSR